MNDSCADFGLVQPMKPFTPTARTAAEEPCKEWIKSASFRCGDTMAPKGYIYVPSFLQKKTEKGVPPVVLPSNPSFKTNVTRALRVYISTY